MWESDGDRGPHQRRKYESDGEYPTCDELVGVLGNAAVQGRVSMQAQGLGPGRQVASTQRGTVMSSSTELREVARDMELMAWGMARKGCRGRFDMRVANGLSTCPSER